jgi:hypothetical protein
MFGNSGRKDPMKKNKWIGLAQAVTIAGMAGLVARAVLADNEVVPYNPGTGGSTNNTCPGYFYGCGKYTNSSGIWIPAPTNITSGTLTDISGLGGSYVSVVMVMDKNTSVQWCGTNTVTFPATPGQKYSFTTYVKNIPPPPQTNQTLTLQITWQ